MIIIWIWMNEMFMMTKFYLISNEHEMNSLNYVYDVYIYVVVYVMFDDEIMIMWWWVNQEIKFEMFQSQFWF